MSQKLGWRIMTIDYERLGKLLIEREIAYNAWVKSTQRYHTDPRSVEYAQWGKSNNVLQDAITDEMEKITYGQKD